MQCRLLSGSVVPINRATTALSKALTRLPRAYAPAQLVAYRRRRIYNVNLSVTHRSFSSSIPTTVSSSKSLSLPSSWSVSSETESDKTEFDAAKESQPTSSDVHKPHSSPYGSASRRSLRGWRKYPNRARANARNPDDEDDDDEGQYFHHLDNSRNRHISLDEEGLMLLRLEGLLESAELPHWFSERTIFSGQKLELALLNNFVAIKESQSHGASSTPHLASLPRYTIHPALYHELHPLLSASLLHCRSKLGIANPLQVMANLHLQYPSAGGITFLNRILLKLAHDDCANLLTLSADDIGDIFAHLFDSIPQPNTLKDVTSGPPFPTRDNSKLDDSLLARMAWLGFKVHRPDHNSLGETNRDDEDGDELDGSEVESESADDGMEISPGFKSNLPNFIKILPLLKSHNSGAPEMGSAVFPMANFINADRGSEALYPVMQRVVEQMVDAARTHGVDRAQLDAKLASLETKTSKDAFLKSQTEFSNSLIIQIQDYDGIANVPEGRQFLTIMERVIRDRRQRGQRISLVSTSSPKLDDEAFKSAEAYSRSIEHGIHVSSLPYEGGFRRTVVVVPNMSKGEVKKVFEEDERIRIKDINLRHLRGQILAGLEDWAKNDTVASDASIGLSEEFLKQIKISDAFWSYRKVHKIAGIALGLYAQRGNTGQIQPADVRQAIEISEQGDAFKDEWLSTYVKSASLPTVTHLPVQLGTEEGRKAALQQAEKQRKMKLKELHKKCNTHEQKLLGGVVDAKNIRVTFNDVHVPAETKDTLRTLTSLSLIRPDAFTYGVLATDKIPGCLLYGPPGTGKTMLAKAVAKESGATVLEISGSDVYDMFVGEGEKNVKAIFTLAKKLSPCIVFIDEADAILGMRSSGTNGGVHRELINQFLREWDGMEDMSAFIMVATNRPFDLDDAVLRRLPRRLLVDLPTEKDRKEILTIHLKDEQLDAGVNLATLATGTPFYSGSDLKNLCVAAALACVKEEMDVAQTAPDESVATSTSTTHAGDSTSEPGSVSQSESKPKYPARRTLKPAHFEKAMEEISASISEDMSSLTAIKKFDEKYGDKRFKRRKMRSWGFAVGDQEKKDSALVRG
ncbi:hypothetical protein KEM54_004760 [Ascosphaera aggregata]|nr:hypothetical protein KEM54_004760 [Ascosphaera aggregata]